MIVLTLARKPCSEGSVAANVLKHGTGGINIEGCRIGSGSQKQATAGRRTIQWGVAEGSCTYEKGTGAIFSTEGRRPANLVLCHLPGCHCLGTVRVRANQSTSVGSGKGHTDTEGHGIYHGVGGVVRPSTADSDGMETVDKWGCQPGCPVADLDQQSGPRKAGGVVRGTEPSRTGQNGIYGIWGRVANVSFEDTGGASRFFKQVGGTKP